MVRHYLVKGRVQGVGFRYFASQAARRLGVTGYAKNLRDGRVECEGTPQQIMQSEKLAQIFGGDMGIYAHRHG